VPVPPFGSTALTRFAAGHGRFTAAGTLHFIHPVRLAAFLSPLPSGIFMSLGIKAFYRACCLPVRLTNPPDFLSLPTARPISILSAGSSFQVRFVSAGLLFLKPLGTFLTMLPKLFLVNLFSLFFGQFPLSLFLEDSIVYWRVPVHRLCIKRT
jgi:hypothetical protein